MSHFFIYIESFSVKIICFFPLAAWVRLWKIHSATQTITCFYCRPWLATVQRVTFWPIVNFIWNQWRLTNSRKMAATWNRLKTVVANFAFCKEVVGRKQCYNRANSLKQKSRRVGFKAFRFWLFSWNFLFLTVFSCSFPILKMFDCSNLS